MRRCIHALIHCRTHDATVLAGVFGALVFAGLPIPAAHAQNPVLRDVEVRSFLGEPLNLRIALAASTEPATSAICQSVIDADPRENALRAGDLILTMVELRETRYLQVRSRAAYNDPVARFSLRIGCPGEPIVDREFTALIDPPPFTILPAAPAEAAATDTRITPSIPVQSAKPPARAKPVVPASGTWTVYAGDTPARLAKGIHPKNRARQRQYIAVLRDLNPQIAGFADDAALTPGMQLALPDLLTLSGIMPRATMATPPDARSTAVAPAPAKKAPAAGKSATRATPQTKPVAVAPAPAKPAEPKATAPSLAAKPAPSSAAKPAPPAAEPAKPAPVVRAAPRAESFQLRLSGSEMDLSRSRNVTDEQRRVLREKLLMLDADDQMAALLSLKNTVKQLEVRLNEMQLRLSATPLPQKTAPPAPASAPATPAAAIPVVPSAAAPTQKPPATAPSAAPAPDSAPAKAPAIVAAAPQPAPTPAPVASPPEKLSAPQASPADTLADYLPSPLLAGGIIAALLVLLAAWAWLRRDGKSKQRFGSLMPGVPQAEATPAESTQPKSAQTSPRESKFPDMPGQPDDAGPPTEQPASEAFLQTSRNVATDMNATARGDTNKPRGDAYKVGGDTAVARANAEFARAEAAAEQVAMESAATARSHIDAPVIFDDTPARFEVDASPATTVDFLVGMDEKLPEDRVRRLQYMHERYPELKTNTISIDDADGVINAARLYYEEAESGSGRDKASELLTFAVEERPQEIRFWLAQFEIFRLENMPAEFTAMAGKFHVLFSHTTAWPMVRHIGHELDPGNPLFAAGGSPLLADETRFDPIAENWLNAPMDFTSDALMSDLRLALLDDHGVSRANFESITARLTATAGVAVS